MFTVTCKNGRILEVDSVEERFSREGKQPKILLNLEVNGAEESLDFYTTLFGDTAATQELTISCEGTQVAVYQGYTQLSDLSLRLLPSGKLLTATLQKVGEQ